MTVLRQTVAIILVGVTLFTVGNGRTIKTITEGTKTTPWNASSTEATVPPGKAKMSINGTTVTTSKEIATVLMNATTIKNTTTLMNDTKSEILFSPINKTDGSNVTIFNNSGSKILDIAFIMDTTGSMGSYIDSARNNIRSLVDEIAVNSNIDLRVALIEYRDHPPEETSFVTRTNDFTKSVEKMKEWLKKAVAQGGGDTPEAVAEGLLDVTKLSWRPEAAKIAVLISDAPPHGLDPMIDSFKQGSPKGNDPIKIVQDLAKREITIYAVGCEPSIDPYKDFFMALAYMTGGQYIPLSDPVYLIQAIIGGAREELSLQKFSKDVEQEINRIKASGAVVDEASIVKAVYGKLQQQGATSQQLLRNNKTLEGPSGLAKIFSASASMADVRTAYKSEFSPPSKRMSGEYSADFMSAPVAKRVDSSASYISHPTEASPSFPGRPDVGESYSTVDSAISVEQVARLVRKKTAKLSTP